ncbi:MAG: UvrD-helicase domain-containing protein [Polyangiaceae bacterium]
MGAILARISALKNAGIDADAFAKGEVKADDASEYDEITSLVYPRYVAMMRGFQAFDFDDLVCEVSRLWKKRPDVRDKYVKRFRYIIVDEYQDTNRAQLELVRLLGSEHKNVCVVGDDDQSIYAWRGADVRNILDFEEHFAGAKVVRLEENYRSSSEILAVASVVLDKSSARRHKKTIIATRPGGARVREVVCADTEVEAAFVARTIDDLVRSGEVRRKEIAVLYRSNLQAAEIESALKERAIPLRMVGGTQFYERKEVKDLLAYLKVALTPFDEISLRRVINYPSRGIGDVALERLASHATAHSISLFTAVTRAHAV